jgi:hypothetical protein
MDQTDNQTDARSPTLVVVLGMHRSGTSAITRAVETMGGNFGSRLMPAVSGVNDKGFFEDLDVNALNAEVMDAAGTDWHAIAPTELQTIDQHRLDELRAKAEALLRDRLSVDTFVLKDPRIARLLPFWQPVFAHLNVRVVYLIAVRNPISVVESLAKRNDFREEKSYMLWLAHMVPALEMTRDNVRAFLNYDRLMDFPGRELKVVATQLDLPLDTSRVEEFEKEFLDGQLRHTQFSEQDLRASQSAPRQLKDLFAVLEAASWAGDPRHTPELGKALEEANSLLDDIAPLLRHEWSTERHVQQLHAMLATSSARIAELDSELAERNHRVWELDRDLGERSHRVWELDTVLAERNHRVWVLDKAIADQYCRLEETDKALTDSRHQIEELGRELSAAEEMQRRIEQLTSENAAQREIIRLKEQTISSLQAELSNSAEATARMLRSVSWRVTAPLRVIRRSVGQKRS